MRTSPKLRDALVVAAIAAAFRVLGALLIRALGFSVVSDDDFARVVIAQRFAFEPHLDPTGTSWLPAPFWIVGGAMKIFGATLATARVVAVLSAALGSAALGATAVLVGLRPRRALAAALAVAAMPWGMQLAVATVPEAPAAACAALGAMTLASGSPALRLVGGLALLFSALSRYDAWPLAIAFAVCTALEARRASRRERWLLLGAALLALAGPAAWALWQWRRFGDAFRYVRLVRSYRQAMGPGPTLAQRLLGYPAGIVEEMREVLGAGVVAAMLAFALRRRARASASAHQASDAKVASSPPSAFDVRWSRPLALALLQLLFLIYGDVRDGAPTHHPERALLGPATIVLFASADVVGAFLSTVASARRRIGWAAVAFAAMAGWIALRVHRTLWWYAAAPRSREVAAGAALARVVPSATRVLLDTRDYPGGSIDYGYYAVIASFGRPLDVVIDRDQDPRKPRRPSAFIDVAALRRRLAESRATAMLAWGETRCTVAGAVGASLVAHESLTPDAGGSWCIWLLPPSP